MSKKPGNRRVLSLLVTTCMPLLSVPASHAQTAAAKIGTATTRPKPMTMPADAASAGKEQIVVTGSRGLGRKVTDSINPIDVVTSAQLTRTGQGDLGDALVLTNPSLNMQAHQTDQAALTSSIRMRGLNPDQVLILIDGKRRHTTANINSDSGPESGETPVDIDMIPVSMIDHIEVLRDGAAAQYGSDAIAGVVNIILKKSAHGGSEQGLVGANYQGDGFTYLVRGDHGFSLGDDGFLHVALEFKHNDLTSRDAVDNRTGRKDFHQEGEPDQTRANAAINWGKDLFGGKANFYGNVIYGHRHGETPQFFRVASTLPSYYPWGFDPVDTSDEDDYAATIGLKGDDFLGFGWDVSSTYGSDNIHLRQHDSANLSYLQTYGWTPTSFTLRGFQSTQWTNNLDFHRAIPVPVLAAPLHLAFGAEHRMESYTMSAGDYASYYGAGSQALVGLSPTNAGSWYRDVYAGYVDLDIQPVKHLDVDVAGRFEHYTDAGDAKTGKIATRYDFNRYFAIRGAISTGFRAPTLAEEHYSTLGVAPTYAGGQLAVNSNAAAALGAVPLTPEFSTNVSAGFVLRPIKNLNITTDVYQINIRDRIVNGGSYSGLQAVDAIQAMGIQVPSTISPSAVTAHYYSNGASTRTQGLDIVANYLTDLNRMGRITWDLGISLNRTRLTHLGDDTNGNPLLTAQGISYLTTTSPRSKIMLGARWNWRKFDVYLQELRWGETKDMKSFRSGPFANSNSVFYQFVNTPVWVTNMELGYQATQKIHVAVGANNLFNMKPRRLPANGAYAGAEIYDDYSNQMGYNGGYYYLRVNTTF
ncbi:TonB-dependent receptor [Gluconacetobacter azotocaptans]|uniref:TonB-dependent receptor n=1 Tax=Gluconacetobacter azotocaptans TaxID=142834 RepID=A0A7W4JSX2_9PROT|nr:TonB-dependent receptor [Gluconacetobacter azotocaptans]MBB2190285.1 TonB-dependent receptor [Gluconacetobacter azotocaptans]